MGSLVHVEVSKHIRSFQKQDPSFPQRLDDEVFLDMTRSLDTLSFLRWALFGKCVITDTVDLNCK